MKINIDFTGGSDGYERLAYSSLKIVWFWSAQELYLSREGHIQKQSYYDNQRIREK
jgi:hypothetical protein